MSGPPNVTPPESTPRPGGGLRIGFLTHEPFYPPSGGGSAAALYLVRELVRRGHSVEVFGPALKDAEEVERRFDIRLRPFTRWQMGRTTRLRTIKYLAYPRALTGLVKHAVRRGAAFDVLLSQHSISAVAAGTLRRQLGIPAVFNFLDCLTGFMETWPPYLMPRPIARGLVHYELSLPRRYGADAVLTVSDALRERVIANGYPADRVRAIYYGYDASLFRRPENRPDPDDPEPVVVMHGSFDHHHLGPIAKGAVLTVHKQRPDVRFRFIGPRTPALEKFLSEVRAAAPAVPLDPVGFVAYESIPSMLAQATIGITPYEPSTGTHCAFIAKTVEYLALGLPVVSTPLESAKRYYAGLEAVRFSAADGTSFGQGILEWLSIPAERRRLAVEPARRKVEAELDWSRVCGRAVEFIEQAMASRAGSRSRG